MTREDLIELFGDDIDEILDALEKGMPAAIESLTNAMLTRLHFDTVIFGNRIQQYTQALLEQGISESFIVSSLENDMKSGGRIFGELTNNIKAGIKELVNQSGRLGQLEQYGNKYEMFTWVTVSGHRICIDCEGRSGQEKTYNEWYEAGLPGSGWSVCRGYCYCVLDPTGTLSKQVDAPGDLQEQNSRQNR
tara:strand:- start:2053 stop:2625 length:573 start_codon:yes stop_codon:yes gene_type:complete